MTVNVVSKSERGPCDGRGFANDQYGEDSDDSLWNVLYGRDCIPLMCPDSSLVVLVGHPHSALLVWRNDGSLNRNMDLEFEWNRGGSSGDDNRFRLCSRGDERQFIWDKQMCCLDSRMLFNF